ncbi:MAG: flagellin [Lachnospiraceae bacterium]
MVVQHNLRAMNSNRMLGLTANVQSKSTEKLSSGYKINRAADDAAGLSISEKMRKQIRGLSQASLNACDGISAVQTAEGALNEVQDMLQRMNELAVKASNGSMSEDDRNYVQNEIDQLVTELDRVAETTKFNETYLLKGMGEAVTKTLNAYDAGLAGKLTDNGNGTSTFVLDKALEIGSKIEIAGKEYTIDDTSDRTKTDDDYVSAVKADTITLKTGDSITVDGKTTTVVDKTDLNTAKGAGFGWAADDTFTDSRGIKWTVKADNATNLGDDTTSLADAKEAGAGFVEIGKINDIIDAGSVITKLGTKVDEYDPIEVVDTLADDEYSSLNADLSAKAVNGGTTSLKEGDVITRNGKEITVTEETAESFADVSKDIMKLEADATTPKKVYIRDKDGTEKEYIVSTKTDLSDSAELKATREDIINMIKEGYDVSIGNNTSYETIYGVDSTLEEDSVTATTGTTATEVYKIIADELVKANSIGADTAATVVNKNDGTFEITQGTVEVKGAITLNLHVGADADMTNKISISVDSMSAAGLGVKGLKVSGVNGVEATYAIDAITDGIQRVSQQRSTLGAVQNRLEHTIANLDNVVENTTAAESQIRDTDMATEMVKYSNNNILAQAGQAMLAQANQSNQGVLSLLG